MLAYAAHTCIKKSSKKLVKSYYFTPWPAYATYALVTQFSPSLDDEDVHTKVKRLATSSGRSTEEVAYQVQ